MARLIIIAATVILSIVPNVSAATLVRVNTYKVVATAYTEAEEECGRPFGHPDYGRTASGEFVRFGHIAVDPDFIPLHSIVYIEGAGDLDGIYEAKDTGGAIKGQRIDIYLPNKQDALKFGRREVKLYVLREGEFMAFEKLYTRKFYTNQENVRLPERKTSKSAGYDFYLTDDVLIKSKELKMVHSGVHVKMYPDDVLLLFARSSTAKLGLLLANSVAVVDADYDGEILFPLYNLTDKDVILKAGDRVVQGVFLKYNTLGDIVNQQRIGGFGSTNN